MGRLWTLEIPDMTMRVTATVFASLCGLLTLNTSAEQLDAIEWREDLAALVDTLKETHINLFHTADEAEFEAAVTDLERSIPDMQGHEIALEMVRITAMIGDGHTWLYYGAPLSAHRYPIHVHPFVDGAFVTHATKSFQHLIGVQLLRVGGVPVQDILEAAGSYVGRDNEWTVLERIPRLLTMTEFLHAKGFVADMDSAEYEFEDDSGKTLSEVLKPISLEAYNKEISRGELPGKELLLRQDMDKAYWMTFLKKEKAVYMKFNAVQNREGGPHLAGFSRDLEKFIEENKAKRLIIDVRHNGGGNGDLTPPLIKRIARNERINQEGSLFVITGRRTFSAALMFTMRMERETNALFAGEPGGGKPNSYSEYNGFTLPNSQMRGSVSSLFHQEGEPDDTREFLPVDIPISVTSRDYFSGRDPVLEAVLAYKN